MSKLVLWLGADQGEFLPVEVLVVKKNICAQFVTIACLLAWQAPAHAGWGKLTVTTGAGDQVVVKRGLFGRKTVVQDRLGDNFSTSHGWFGTKSTEANVLGNGIRYNKGLFGISSASAHTLLGDNLESHKGLFYRNTNVNLSGINSLVGQYLGGGASGAAADQASQAGAGQGQTPLPRLNAPDLNDNQPSIPDAFPNQSPN